MGQEIVACVVVQSVREDKPICRVETAVRNADGDICVAGTAVTYTMPLLAYEVDDS